jgi:glutamyl-tRNA reductase
VELGRKIFGSLEGKKVLLVGAGEMAELAVEHLIRDRADSIIVANRTFERGMALAGRFGGQAVNFAEIPSVLAYADIIISSTGARNIVISAEDVKSVLRKRRNSPLFFIDIAVPRDIDPDVNKLGNCYLYDIDDLKGVIEENVESRNREAVKAERIIEESVINFRKWLDSLHLVPTIVDLKAKVSDIVCRETTKTFLAMNINIDKDSDQIKNMTDAIVSKLMHDPIRFLKNSCSHHLEESKNLSITRALFGLDD